MAASNTRFTQNSLGQSKTPIDSDHGIYRDLRNVVANYSFETSRRFAGIQPNSGLPDYSRLSCGVGGYAAWGWVLRGSTRTLAILAAICFDQKMIRRRQSQQHH